MFLALKKHHCQGKFTFIYNSFFLFFLIIHTLFHPLTFECFQCHPIITSV